jgi:DNA-binding SARP family transcriptional activator
LRRPECLRSLQLSDILLAATLTHQPSTRIQICGRLAVEIDGEPVTALIPRRQGRVLFSYLVLNRHRYSSREVLIEALWPGEQPPDPDGALSTVLSRLRRAIGMDAIEGRGEIRLVLPLDAWIDYEAAEEAIHRAESAVAQGRWGRAWGPSLVALFVARRGFLDGEDAPWIEPLRRRLEDIQISALECYTASALGLAGSELHVGERTARQLIELAPYRESGHRLLMEILSARGNTAEALRAYEDLRTLLREELGATPSPAIQALQVQLLKAAARGG